jgi:phosphoribosylformylglycinamidine synthase I
MSQTRVLLLRTAGTNCDRELAHAFQLVGAAVDTLHINTLLQNPAQLADYQILGFPGGFSYGDDIASGKILANQLIHHLAAPLRTFVNDGKLVIGICNGFQVLVKSGLLPGPMPQLAEGDWHPATLTYNTHGRFEDRWVKLKPISKKCAWIPNDASGIPPMILDLPIAHGEGRFVTRDGGGAVMQALRANDQIAFEYVNADGTRATEFPALPNGSQDSIAGICDITGRVLGLMPHPERVVHAENHPLFTRGGGHASGLVIFQSALAYLHARETVTV